MLYTRTRALVEKETHTDTQINARALCGEVWKRERGTIENEIFAIISVATASRHTYTLPRRLDVPRYLSMVRCILLYASRYFWFSMI